MATWLVEQQGLGLSKGTRSSMQQNPEQLMPFAMCLQRGAEGKRLCHAQQSRQTPHFNAVRELRHLAPTVCRACIKAMMAALQQVCSRASLSMHTPTHPVARS